MKHQTIIQLLFLVFILISSNLLSRDIKKDFHESYDVKPGAYLYLKHGDGDVTISPWDKDIVDIEVHYEADYFSIGKGKKYEFDIEFSQDGDEIRVFEKIKRSVHIGIKGNKIINYIYKIRTPKYLDLNIVGDDGNVSIEDMQGKIECRLSDGDLELENISTKFTEIDMDDGELSIKKFEGELKINNDDGNVTIHDYTGTDCSVDTEDGNIEIIKAEGNFDIHSDDGEVELREVSIGSLTATSSDGDIYLDIISSNEIDMDIKTDDASVTVDMHKGASAKIVIDTDDGRIKTSLTNAEFERTKKNHYTGEMNDGEGRIRIRTNDGDVKLRENR